MRLFLLLSHEIILAFLDDWKQPTIM